MTTNHNPDNQGRVSRREALRRGALGAAGLIAAGGLSSRAFAAEPAKTPQQIAADEKAARDEAAKAKGPGAELIYIPTKGTVRRKEPTRSCPSGTLWTFSRTI